MLRRNGPALRKLQLLRPSCLSAQQVCARSYAAVAAPSTIPTTPFTSSFPLHQPENGGKDYKPPDERTIKLGKTLRTLQPLLPSLLLTPLPTAILSPQITLHLFPSTHPHLPAVHGRVAYIAAVWTSPIAWGRVPIIGNVRLEILSERMVKSPSPAGFDPTSVAPREQLVVRWRTIGKKIGGGDKVATRAEDEFTGLFIFQFDEEGRIVKHVIEHVQEGGNWEKGVGARVVGLTDWLLGGRNKEPEGSLAPCCSTMGN
ncbi:hypothetical protein VE00_04743 [Pseudogymnoascus sp. WSF 3629]|nr:hypothetical protein VE00_04743 [Pseudogymnoascus sp. WSF 3629]